LTVRRATRIITMKKATRINTNEDGEELRRATGDDKSDQWLGRARS
jgi:hypothetical protein